MNAEQLARLRSRPWSKYGFVAAQVSEDIDALLADYDKVVELLGRMSDGQLRLWQAVQSAHAASLSLNSIAGEARSWMYDAG